MEQYKELKSRLNGRIITFKRSGEKFDLDKEEDVEKLNSLRDGKYIWFDIHNGILDFIDL